MSQTNSFLYSLPMEQIPEFWKNGTRIDVLFAPFRNEFVNPKDKETKLSSWRDIIYIYCNHYKILTFTLSDFQKFFNHFGKSPGCLKEVIEELLKTGEIIYLEDFLQKPAETWVGWAANTLIKKPVVWSFTKIIGTFNNDNTNRKYVHIKVLQQESEALLRAISENYKNKIINVGKLLELQLSEHIKSEHIKLLLHFLYCRGDIYMIEVKCKNNNFEENTLIKFKEGKSTENISAVDIDIYMLEMSEKTLLEEIERMETQINKIIVDTKKYLIEGQKQMAKSNLRKKHDLEKRILKRADALHNIQTLLSRLQDATIDVEVIGAYKTAISSLTNIFKETGLTEDLVTKTMLKVGDVLDMHEEIQESLIQSISNEDEDLEKELEKLLETDKTETINTPIEDAASNELQDLEEQLGKLKLPDIPVGNVSPIKSRISN